MAREPGLTVVGLSHLPYEEALCRQLELRDRCAESDGRENFLMLIQHPPVITVGRSGGMEDVLAGEDALRKKGVNVVRTNRGGKVTFHGPGQLVIYPIIDLTRQGRDLHRYLRDIERWLIEVLAEYAISARVRPPFTGVWVGDKKIAAVGIAVRRWVSYHGIALNVNTDLSYFDLINPCGLGRLNVTSMERLLGRSVSLGGVARKAATIFGRRFRFRDLCWQDEGVTAK